jgi:hypothetical protein
VKVKEAPAAIVMLLQAAGMGFQPICGWLVGPAGMVTVVPQLGTQPLAQLFGLNQSLLTAPVQLSLAGAALTVTVTGTRALSTQPGT